MKRVVLYARVSTFDQCPETQQLDLHRLAEQRGFAVIHEYTDKISGAKAKRPALDQMLGAAHRREFDVVLVWAADRLARSVRGQPCPALLPTPQDSARERLRGHADSSSAKLPNLFF